MMKDPDLPQPIRTTPTQERGWYLFFDVTNWRRERVSLAMTNAPDELGTNTRTEGVRTQL
jgi:hypothetical protein